jgi:hypothetical protein
VTLAGLAVVVVEALSEVAGLAVMETIHAQSQLKELLEVLVVVVRLHQFQVHQ